MLSFRIWCGRGCWVVWLVGLLRWKHDGGIGGRDVRGVVVLCAAAAEEEEGDNKRAHEL